MRKIGQGAFGEVGEFVWHGTHVAVKASGVGAGDAAALAAEVQLYELLSNRPHPNVVAVMGVCTDASDGRMRLVMRLCLKGSLEDLLLRSRVEVRAHCR